MNDRHQAPSYPLRMPPELKERMAESAKLSGRSLHAEIITRLQQSFNLEPMKDAKRDDLVKLVNELVDHKLAMFSTPTASAPSRGAVDPADKSVLDLLGDLESDSKKSNALRKERKDQMDAERNDPSKKH